MDRVLVTDPIDPAGIALLEKSAEVVRPPDTRVETLRALSREVDALLIRSKLPDDLFDTAPRIRAVCVHGSGTDLVNLSAASERGVMVANVPGGNAQSVAEYCLMAILLLARNFRSVDRSLRSEAWDTARAEDKAALELDRKTLGIVLYPGFEVLDVFGPLEMWSYVPDFKVVMVSDCCAALSDEEHLATLETFIQQFGDVMTWQDVIKRLA